jgi:Prenyltransferase and squalene oxidase repeat
VSWQATSFLVLALALAAGFGWYEREKPPARVLALVAALAALAVVGRLAFAAIPNVKPTTDIVLFAGYALGAIPGFAVGAVTAIVSNIFLSQGPWTVWQMAGWGAVGIGGALLARMMRGREPGRLMLAAVCGLAGLAFGAWMDVYQWTLGARQDLDSYLVVAATSLPYNLAHAAGNVVFCLLIGPAFIRALGRYRRRLEVRWVPAAAGATGLLIAVLVAFPVAVGAATPSERAERYLLRAQNPDGGFGAAPGQVSSPLYSGWAGLGLAAAGRNPRDVARRGGSSLAVYVRRGLRAARDIGEIERTVMVLETAGLDSRRAGGRDLVARILTRRRADGSISGFVSYTAFGVLALRAAGEPAGRATVEWLVRSQNADGGFGVARSASSDSDMTGAALQALAVVGRARSGAARRAVGYLRASQGPDGGFGLAQGRSSNAQSTAYAVQGLVAARASGGAVPRALRYLTRLQRRDGSIAYSSSSAQTPVWVTAQALAALRREALPVAAVPRVPRRARRAAAPRAGVAAEGPDVAGKLGKGSNKEESSSAGESPRSSPGRDSGPAPSDDPAARPQVAAAPHHVAAAGSRAGPSPARAAARDPGGAGVSAWLVIAVVVAIAALLLVFRRRLPRRRPPRRA